jgi:uridine kinase
MEILIGDNNPKTYVVGIGGGTASGKTKITSLLLQEFQKHEKLKPTQIISITLDSFYLPVKEPKGFNFDEPEAIGLKEARSTVEKFINMQEVIIPHYDFSIHNRTNNGTRIELNPFADRVIIIIEGIHALHQNLHDLYDITLYIHADKETRLSRRINRDVVERGRTAESVKEQWNKTVQPTFEKYEDKYKKSANVILNNNGNSDLSEKISLYANILLGV